MCFGPPPLRVAAIRYAPYISVFDVMHLPSVMNLSINANQGAHHPSSRVALKQRYIAPPLPQHTSCPKQVYYVFDIRRPVVLDWLIWVQYSFQDERGNLPQRWRSG